MEEKYVKHPYESDKIHFWRGTKPRHGCFTALVYILSVTAVAL
jgi:hypothetical protein